MELRPMLTCNFKCLAVRVAYGVVTANELFRLNRPVLFTVTTRSFAQRTTALHVTCVDGCCKTSFLGGGGAVTV